MDIITAHKQIHWFCKGYDLKAINSLKIFDEATQISSGTVQEKL